MATTNTYKVREIVQDAFLKSGIAAEDDPVTAVQSAIGARELDRMLKSWQNFEYSVWVKTQQTVTLTTAASYTLNPVRPIRILGAWLVRSGGVEIPMIEMTRQEYMDLPVKTSTGIPTQYYYDKQREAALFYVWPVLGAVAGETVKIDYERETEDQIDINATLDMPGEWWSAVVYNLADRLGDTYGEANPKIERKALFELELALAADHEGSVTFWGDG